MYPGIVLSSFLVLGVLVIFFITGCGKEPSPEPVIPPPATLPTISINPEYDTQIERGGAITFTWIIKGDFKNSTITINDSIISTKAVGEYSMKVTNITYFKVSCEASSGAAIKKAIKITVRDPVFLPPTLFVSAYPTHVQINSTVVVSFIATNTDSVVSDLPGVPVVYELYGSFESPLLTENVTYNFTAYGKGGNLSKSVTITIDPPPPPPPNLLFENFLCNFGPWKKIKLEFRFAPDGQWELEEIWECMQDDLMYYYLYPSKLAIYENGEIRCYEGEPSGSQGPWSLNDSTLNTGWDYNIAILNEDSLVWIYESPDIHGNMTWVRETFIHPNK